MRNENQKKIKDMTADELKEYKRIKARESRGKIRITVTDPALLKMLASFVETPSYKEYK